MTLVVDQAKQNSTTSSADLEKLGLSYDPEEDSRHFFTFVASLEINLEEVIPWGRLRSQFNNLGKHFPTAKRLISHFNLNYYSNRKKKNWNELDKKLLIWVSFKYVMQQTKDSSNQPFQFSEISDGFWNQISLILGLEKGMAKKRWAMMSRKIQDAQEWSALEDEIICQAAIGQDSRQSWRNLSDTLYQTANIYRIPKHIRAHWFNHLNPKIKKGQWTLQEDLKLIELVQQLGKKWAQIVKLIQGRNDNMVKNRYYQLIKTEKNNAQHTEEEDSAEQESHHYQQKLEQNLVQRVLERINRQLSIQTNCIEEEQNDISSAQQLNKSLPPDSEILQKPSPTMMNLNNFAQNKDEVFQSKSDPQEGNIFRLVQKNIDGHSSFMINQSPAKQFDTKSEPQDLKKPIIQYGQNSEVKDENQSDAEDEQQELLEESYQPDIFFNNTQPKFYRKTLPPQMDKYKDEEYFRQLQSLNYQLNQLSNYKSRYQESCQTKDRQPNNLQNCGSAHQNQEISDEDIFYKE